MLLSPIGGQALLSSASSLIHRGRLPGCSVASLRLIPRPDTLISADVIKVALIIASAIGGATGVVSFVLPGRATSPRYAITGEERDLEVVMKDETELGGTGPIAGEEPPPSGSEA
jgi:hypothetical protein